MRIHIYIYVYIHRLTLARTSPGLTRQILETKLSCLGVCFVVKTASWQMTGIG